MASDVEGAGTADAPWILTTPPGTSEFEAWRDEASDPPALVVQVGSTQLRYHLRCLDDLHAMLKAHGDWMPLGNADEQKEAKDGTVEAWARAEDNPVGGWYGLKKGLRGRFGSYVPPVMEVLGLAEVEHAPRNNRMRGTSEPRKSARRRHQPSTAPQRARTGRSKGRSTSTPHRPRRSPPHGRPPTVSTAMRPAPAGRNAAARSVRSPAAS